MAFHRLAVPTYTGGLPGGYDYINNAVVGTPALADGPRAVGLNQGTYFHGFGEDATNRVANRGLKALAENTDYLDNLLRRDIASPTRTVDATAGAPTSSVTITGPGIFLGAAGTPNTVAGINTVFELTDDQDNEIVDTLTLAPCQITAVGGGTIGSGLFSTGNVTLTISPAIPAGKNYRVYYGTRTNLATLPVDALTTIRIRGAEEVSAELIGTGGAALIGMAAIAGSPYQLTLGTVQDALNTLIGVDNVISALLTAHDNIRTLTTTATLHSPNRDNVVVLSPAASFNLQLPVPSTCTGKRVFLIADGNVTSAKVVTLVRAGAENINGVASNFPIDVAYGVWILVSDGTNWHVRGMFTHLRPTTTQTSNFSVSYPYSYYPVDTTGGAISAQLPNPATFKSREIVLQDVATGGSFDAHALTLVRFGAEKIQNLAADYVYETRGGKIRLYCDGTNWWFV